MKAMFVGALVLLSAACGAYQFPSSPSPQTGTVNGQVSIIPCGPVEPGASNCGGKPAAGVQIEFKNGQTIYGTVTDSGGNYSIQLRPATYQVQFKGYMRIVSGPRAVTVAADSSLVANYLLDSGIRAPAPAS
jgi:hypothetical protein